MITLNYINEKVCCSISDEQINARKIRLDKVLDIRGRINSGKYNPAEHLDIVVDKLLEDILDLQPEAQLKLVGSKHR